MLSRIAVCCDTPMIQTFIFAGAELYCRKCGTTVGIMNADYVEATPELEKQKVVLGYCEKLHISTCTQKRMC